MSLDANGNGGGIVMPVQPMGGYGYPMNQGFANDMFGGNSIWLIILFLFAFMGNGWGGFGGFGMNGLGGQNLMMWPWLMTNQTDNLVTSGFNNSGVNTALSGIQASITSGFGDVQNSLCGGFAGVNQNIANAASGIQNSLCGGFAGVNQTMSDGFAQAEIANNARQMADMQQSFAMQTAITQGMNAIQSQSQTREAIAAVNASNLAEHCQDRYDAQRNATDIITNATGNTQTMLNAINSGFQAIQDKLCQQETDALKAQVSNLQSQLAMKDLAASQAAQTAQLIADNTAQTQYIVNRTAPYPIPSYTVNPPYGYYNTNVGCACAA